ncbi:MAG: hypothetical protein QXR09_03615 [Candidatus Aenigmatarchaeota archaeon]
MALPFLQQKPETSPRIPVDRVRELSSRGFSEVDIIDILRKEGYSADEIDEALTQALKMGVAGISPPVETEVSLPKLEELQPKKTVPEVPETSLPPEYYASSAYAETAYPTEEYLEFLIKEKTADLDEKIREFVVRYSELEKRVAELNNQLNELVKTRTTSEQLILAKLEEVKNLLSDFETRISGLEKAFKDALPALIESVRALSDLVHKVKKF